MKKTILMVFSCFILNDCLSQIIYYRTFNNSLPFNNEIKLTPPKVKSIDWCTNLSPIINQISLIDDIKDDSILLVNNVKNDTNGIIQTDKITKIIVQLLTTFSQKLQIINIDKLNLTRQILGLSFNDSLESYSKAVWIAKHMDAQYLLYSTLSGEVLQPILNMQLILVETGEIIWFSNHILIQ